MYYEKDIEMKIMLLFCINQCMVAVAIENIVTVASNRKLVIFVRTLDLTLYDHQSWRIQLDYRIP